MTLLPIPFNNPDTYPGHTGVDFGQPGGTPFRASGPGVVTVRGYSARSGYTIWVRYDVGCEVGYVHMNSHRDCPAPGTHVVEGSFLGYVGRLGTNSTGNHLHVEVEGYSSTAGFWQWFTPNRVVGHATTSKDNSQMEDDMTPDQASQLDAVYKALFGPNNGSASTKSPLGWKNVYDDAQSSAYGLLPISLHNQTLIVKNAGELAAIKTALAQISVGSGVALDMKAIEDAAERGARDALSGLTLVSKDS